MLVKAPPTRDTPAVLSCQHVACPWRFPNYFTDQWEWLQHVSEEFVKHSLQLLELPLPGAASPVPPKVLLDLPLDQRVWIHGERDVAMLALADDYSIEVPAVKELLEAVELGVRECSQGQELTFVGHQQFRQVGDDEESAEMTGQLPKQVSGRFVGQSARGQAFAWSEEILEEGMCGGAVLDDRGQCVGLIEGIVPSFANTPVVPSTASSEEHQQLTAAWRMKKALENHVAFIPAVELADFIENPDELLLTGTALGGDQDDDELW